MDLVVPVYNMCNVYLLCVEVESGGSGEGGSGGSESSWFLVPPGSRYKFNKPVKRVLSVSTICRNTMRLKIVLCCVCEDSTHSIVPELLDTN